MAIALKYNTASQEIPLGYFLDSTDGNTEETALTIANTDIKLWKTGATTLANKNSGGATHISNGIYYCVLDATDTNTYGPLVVFVHVAGSLAVKVECEVINALVWDSLYGTDLQQVDTQQWDGANTGASDTAIIAAPTNFADLAITVTTGKVTIGTNDDKTGYSISGTKQTLDALNDISAANVNSEVSDVINTDTSGEPAQGAPPATASLRTKIDNLYKGWRNKTTVTSTTISIFNDAGDTVDHKSTHSDDSTTYTRGEIATGP